MADLDEIAKQITRLAEDARIRDKALSNRLVALHENTQRLAEKVQQQESRISGHERRMSRSSERVRSAIESTSTLDMETQAYQGAVIAHMRTIDALCVKMQSELEALQRSNNSQTSILKSLRRWTPIVTPIVTAVVAAIATVVAAYLSQPHVAVPSSTTFAPSPMSTTTRSP